MKNRSQDIGLLLKKQRVPLEEQLRIAIEKDATNERYVHLSKRKRGESPEDFANRLFHSSSEYQFVRVVFNGESNYVAFGVPGPLITDHGKFTVIPGQVVGGRWGVHHILVYPDLDEALAESSVFIRLDSGCLSGQLFGDKTCDCKQQFDMSLKMCAEKESGIVINIPGHDGRGWCEFKMANQQIMDECNLDTVQAAKLFYQNHDAIDQRTYTEAVIIIKALGFSKEHRFELATNNPRKIGAFTALGMNVAETKRVIAENMNPILQRNLKAKSKEWNHSIDIPRSSRNQ